MSEDSSYVSPRAGCICGRGALTQVIDIWSGGQFRLQADKAEYTRKLRPRPQISFLPDTPVCECASESK